MAIFIFESFSLSLSFVTDSHIRTVQIEPYRSSLHKNYSYAETIYD
ncbi:hypothetical protein U6G28_03330 [Actinomycetaceae bacterium MB13-C1-2]|nr:hypothetical protein U6G28_03330 [Actinomycetaceae bacterium MB13-C1-2]